MFYYFLYILIKCDVVLFFSYYIYSPFISFFNIKIKKIEKANPVKNYFESNFKVNNLTLIANYSAGLSEIFYYNNRNLQYVTLDANKKFKNELGYPNKLNKNNLLIYELGLPIPLKLVEKLRFELSKFDDYDFLIVSFFNNSFDDMFAEIDNLNTMILVLGVRFKLYFKFCYLRRINDILYYELFLCIKKDKYAYFSNELFNFNINNNFLKKYKIEKVKNNIDFFNQYYFYKNIKNKSDVDKIYYLGNFRFFIFNYNKKLDVFYQLGLHSILAYDHTDIEMREVSIRYASFLTFNYDYIKIFYLREKFKVFSKIDHLLKPYYFDVFFYIPNLVNIYLNKINTYLFRLLTSFFNNIDNFFNLINYVFFRWYTFLLKLILRFSSNKENSNIDFLIISFYRRFYSLTDIKCKDVYSFVYRMFISNKLLFLDKTKTIELKNNVINAKEIKNLYELNLVIPLELINKLKNEFNEPYVNNFSYFLISLDNVELSNNKYFEKDHLFSSNYYDINLVLFVLGSKYKMYFKYTYWNKFSNGKNNFKVVDMLFVLDKCNFNDFKKDMFDLFNKNALSFNFTIGEIANAESYLNREVFYNSYWKWMGDLKFKVWVLDFSFTIFNYDSSLDMYYWFGIFGSLVYVGKVKVDDVFDWYFKMETNDKEYVMFNINDGVLMNRYKNYLYYNKILKGSLVGMSISCFDKIYEKERLSNFKKFQLTNKFCFNYNDYVYIPSSDRLLYYRVRGLISLRW